MNTHLNKASHTAQEGEVDGRAENTNSTTHQFRSGDKGYVYASQRSGYPYIEAEVDILAPFPDIAHMYVVRFPGERNIRLRLILPGEFQTAPDQTLESMRALWRLRQPPPAFDCFITEQTSPANDNWER